MLFIFNYTNYTKHSTYKIIYYPLLLINFRQHFLFFIVQKFPTTDSRLPDSGPTEPASEVVIQRDCHTTNPTLPATPKSTPVPPTASLQPPRTATPSHLFRERIRMHFCVLIAPRLWGIPERIQQLHSYIAERQQFFIFHAYLSRGGARGGGQAMESHKSRN